MNANNSAVDVSENVQYKPLYLFFLAANSLLLSGYILNEFSNVYQLLFIQWCGICGIFFIYRLNDFIDQTHDFRFHLKRFLSSKLHAFFVFQLLLITLPFSFYFLSSTQLALLTLICLLGIIYSLSFSIGSRSYRIKNMFFLKNVFIGFSWGCLILVGADSVSNSLVLGLFVFTCAQVTIGSIIRDIPDIEKDRTFMVKSVPVSLGIPLTLTILHILNILSLGIGFIIKANNNFVMLMFIVVVWRTICLVSIRQNTSSKLWLQTFNLLTCFLIFLILLIEYFLK